MSPFAGPYTFWPKYTMQVINKVNDNIKKLNCEYRQPFPPMKHCFYQTHNCPLLDYPFVDERFFKLLRTPNMKVQRSRHGHRGIYKLFVTGVCHVSIRFKRFACFHQNRSSGTYSQFS